MVEKNEFLKNVYTNYPLYNYYYSTMFGTITVPKGARSKTVVRNILEENNIYGDWSNYDIDYDYFMTVNEISYRVKIEKISYTKLTTKYKYELSIPEKRQSWEKKIRFSQLFPNEDVQDVIHMVRMLHRQSQPNYEPSGVPKKYCPRCSEEWEDEDGVVHEPQYIDSCCTSCGVCKDCEHSVDCVLPCLPPRTITV